MMMEDTAVKSTHVVGGVRLLLRLEGLCALVVATVLYHQLHPAWAQYFWLFFVPDLGLLGFFLGSKAGAITYNTTHSYILPALLVLTGALLNVPDIWPIALIWIAHIGFDRMFGYGLKYRSGFGDTHLGIVGKRKNAA